MENPSATSGIYALEVLSIDSIGPLDKHGTDPYAWAQVRLQFLQAHDPPVHPDLRPESDLHL